ncbi:hypothetical protein BT96DRAFT_518289 [Gymnopus androsaceus JB14]|uniref:Uncharacterized protein n=1 Tax=Gymnopus androsaceus JB14 TaxID=1447944 RepID=A0A6A4HUQ9_9AGAR|nr:hypothetical protein BT96DRAFT_518289 [Gymnopus androsaceus JB14]
MNPTFTVAVCLHWWQFPALQACISFASAPMALLIPLKEPKAFEGSRSLPQCNRSGLQYYLSRHLLGWHGMKRLSCSFNTGTTRRVIESTKFWML